MKKKLQNRGVNTMHAV